MTVLDRKLITRMVNPQPGGNGGGGGAGGAGAYELPAASNSELGGIKLGYPTGTGKFYPVQLDSQQRAYVDVPWTDHYAWDDITSKPATATRWPSWGEVTSKPTSKTVWGKTYLNASSEFQNISGDLSAGSGGGTISQFHSIELNSAGSLSGYGGFIDFHFNGSSADYTSRIIEDANGKLNINQAVFVNYNGNVGIGDANPAYKLEVAGVCRISSKLLVATTDSTYELNVGGAIHAQNGYAEGTWASKSDARMKNVVGDVDLTVEQIAAMPAVKFTWKNDPEKRVHVGTLAQPWQKVLPEAIETTQADTLMMCYGEAAMVSVIKLAQRVLELERMIKEK